MGIPDGRPFGLFGPWSHQQVVEEDQAEEFAIPGTTKIAHHYGSPHVWDLVYSSRTGKSSNPIEVLGVSPRGLPQLWRNPSSYGRSVLRYDILQKMVTDRYGGFPTWWHPYRWRDQRWHEYIDPLALTQTLGGRNEWWQTPSSPVITLHGNQQSRCLTEALLKMKDQKVNIGENLATAKQTFDLFAKNGVTLFKSLGAAKRGNWKDAFRHLGLTPAGKPVGLGVSQRYLEYIYGLKPLMSDIKGGYDLLKQQLKPAMLLYAERNLRADYDEKFVRHDVSRGLELSYHDAGLRYDKVFLVGRVSDSFLHGVTQAGLSNPASVAWELVPWSFAIDWALPIGSVISAMDATHGLEFVGGYRSVTARGTVSVTAKRYPEVNGGATYYRTTTPGVTSMLRFSNQREKISSWPTAEFYAKSPFSTSHAITALALLRQLI